MQNKLLQAQIICEKEGGKLTPVRAKILQLIYEAIVPISAYELLDCLRRIQPNAQPPTVYRALSFLQNHHLIHRLEKDNRFVACEFPAQAHQGFLFICTQCHGVTEMDDQLLREVIEKSAEKRCFAIVECSVEIRGCCQHCRTL
jgi:Fur family zinc uptake transcriptional regulator